MGAEEGGAVPPANPADARGRPAPLGDSPPHLLTAYYAALDTGRFEDAVQSFTADVVYAVPFAGAKEVEPRNVLEGRAALTAYFRARGIHPYRHAILVCASDGESCLVEGISEDADGRPVRTFVASLQLDAGGRIRRYLAYHCEPPVLPAPVAEGPVRGDACALVGRYFAALASGQFTAAAACFSERVLYSHPPYRHTGITDDRRLELHGREELLETFRRRGRTSYRYRIDVCLQRGANCLFENVVLGLPGGRTGGAIASLSLDTEGLIERYAAFYCEPALPRR